MILRAAGEAISLRSAETLKVNEIFFSIQGESLLAGKPTVFVRTATCNLRCTYCDTRYAFWEGNVRSLDSIVEEVKKHPTKYVCLTGGEPLGQQASIPLMRRLLDLGYTVSLETGGGFSVKDVPAGVIKVVDLKTPSSGEMGAMIWENMDLVGSQDQIKFVVGSREDFDWSVATSRAHHLTDRCPVLISPVYGKVQPEQLASWVLESGEPFTLQLQLHKLLWGADKRGV